MERKRDEADESQKIVREWLQRLPDITGLKLNAIAKEVGVATSTLTNPVNRPKEYPHVTSGATLLKISRKFNIPLPAGIADNVVPIRGFTEEALPFKYDAADLGLNKMVKAYVAGREGVEPFVLRTRALDQLGWMPGDIMIRDLNAEWIPTKVVCALWYPPRKSTPITVWRQYQPPFLMTKSSDPTFIEPIHEDDVDRNGSVLISLR